MFLSLLWILLISSFGTDTELRKVIFWLWFFQNQMQNFHLSFSQHNKITQSQKVRQIKREEERRKERRRRARNVSGRDREWASMQESESKRARASVSAWARERKEESGMKWNREGERGEGRKKKKKKGQWETERESKNRRENEKTISFSWTLKYGQVAKLVIWNSWNKHLLMPYEAQWLFYFISCVRIVSKNL